jgi:hypothetical protein
MDESSSIALTKRRCVRFGKDGGGEWGIMPQMPIGFGLFAIIRGIFGVALAVAFIWLIYKLGKLAEAYTTKLKGKR